MKLNETQKTIVRQLFLNPVVCRKKLAHTLGLSNPGLTLAVRPLVDEGIIAFAPKIVTGRAGRNEEPLCLNPNFGYFAGIDVTVSSYHLVLISLAGFTVFEEDYSEVGPVLEKLKYFVGNSKVLNVCVTFRHYGCHKAFTEHESKIYEALKDYKDVPLFFENTVAALADIHRLYHYGEGISLLVKYGPELVAAVLKGDSILRNAKSECSQIGLTLLPNGRPIGEFVEYKALFGKELEEEEGAEKLLADKSRLDPIIDAIAFAAYNADRLFVFDHIIFAGAILSDEEVRGKLLEKMSYMGDRFDASKVTIFENYNEIISQKPALEALITYLLK